MEGGIYHFKSDDNDLELVINIDSDSMAVFVEDEMGGKGIILEETEAKKLLAFLKKHIGK